MDKVNAAVVTFFMGNIDMKCVEMHRRVVNKFNPSGYIHYSIQTDLRHGASMDLAWVLNGVPHKTFEGHEIPHRFDHDVLLFLDVDAVPLNNDAIDFTIQSASEGRLIGDIQRTNHIQNNQHVFVAPSVLAISRETFKKIGKPSALETPRADVAEEYTFTAEETGVPVDFYMPMRYDSSPAECESWALKDGMPVYGRGTTFGWKGRENFWHNFQSFHPGQQEKFLAKCESLLRE